MAIDFRSENIINVDSDLDKYTCPVYMTDLEGDAKTLNCGHTFSSRFVEEVYKKAIKECPLCREHITHVSENNNYSLKEALSDIKSLRKENIDIKKANNALLNENADLKQICKNAVATNKELKEIICDARKENLEKTQLLERMEIAFNRVVDTMEVMKQKLENLESQNVQLHMQINDDKLRYEELSKKFDEETTSLKSQIAEKKYSVCYLPSSSYSYDDIYSSRRKAPQAQPQKQIVTSSSGKNTNCCVKKLAYAFLDVLP